MSTDFIPALRAALDEAEATRNGARLADYAKHIRALMDELKDARNEIARLTAHGKALHEMVDQLQHGTT